MNHVAITYAIWKIRNDKIFESKDIDPWLACIFGSWVPWGTHILTRVARSYVIIVFLLIFILMNWNEINLFSVKKKWHPICYYPKVLNILISLVWTCWQWAGPVGQVWQWPNVQKPFVNCEREHRIARSFTDSIFFFFFTLSLSESQVSKITLKHQTLFLSISKLIQSSLYTRCA